MSNETQATVYRVPEGNLETLKTRIAKLAKRAAKLHSDAIALNVLGFDNVESTRNGFPVVRRVYNVTVSGPAPKINGWEFVAVLEPVADEKGTNLGNIVRNVPNATVALPEAFRTATSKCDHCNTTRRRNETFILAAVSVPGYFGAQFKQVGRNCLRDFLGHSSPEAFAELAQMIIDAADFCEDAQDYDGPRGGGRLDRFIAADVMALAAVSIRLEGWTSSTAARENGLTSTAGSVAGWINATADFRAKFKVQLVPSTDDQQLAEQVSEWLKTLATRPELNDYFYNLSLLGQGATIDSKSLGLICSAVPTYLREQEREVNRRKRMEEDVNSNFVGEVGKRMDFEVTLVYTTTTETRFGTSNLYKFKDAAGNVITWWSSNDFRLANMDAIRIGDEVKITAMVKDHTTYKDIKQTVITRAVLWVSPEDKKAAAKVRKAERDDFTKLHDDNVANNPNFYNAYHPDFGKKL